MSNLEPFGKILILAGVFVVVLGILLVFWGKIPFLDRLPGDIILQKGNLRFIFPIATCLIISVILTIVVNIIIRLFWK